MGISHEGTAMNADALPDYAELRCLSNFSFLHGASHPEELVERAQALGYRALALVDECSLAGVVRAHVAAKKHGFKLLIGSQFQVRCDAPFTLVVLACNLNGYGNLCEFITRLRRRAPKGTYRLTLGDIDAQALADCVVVAVPDRHSDQDPMDTIARWLLQHFMGRCWLGVEQLCRFDDEMRLHQLRQSSALTAVPLVAFACTCARANPCTTCSPPRALASRSPNAASRWSPAPSSACARASRWASSTPPTCWPKRSWWPRAAIFRSTSCATSTRAR
jgi:hypothetical protein